MNRLFITGTNSGCGKTTVTCAVLSALTARWIVPTAFKCGPDYIDTMFHRAVSGVRAYNLDPFFLDGDALRSHLARNAGEISVIEGAMAYYDGIAATDEASAYSVARKTKTPVILVVSARSIGSSIGAVIDGFKRYRPENNISGVIFNDASRERYPDLQKIAESVGLRAYGYMPRKERWSMPSRYLGLLMTDEIEDLKHTLAELGEQAEQSLDIDGLIALAKTAPVLKAGEIPVPIVKSEIRLAVARDEAFCFLYEENLELFQDLGCKPVFFSPLRDDALPEDIHGLYICGGYPELHAKELAANKSMLESIRQAIERGVPSIAEGGGFMYLHERIGEMPMCGVIHAAAFETARLQRFGYITLTAERDNLLCMAGDAIRSNEFHYWDSTAPGEGFIASKAGRDFSYPCVHATDSLYAGFPHLYFLANPEFAKNFVKKMMQYKG